MIDTFSANSLKVLKNSKTEFEKKYIEGIELSGPKNENLELGNRLHALICYYLKNYEIEKFENMLNKKEREIWEKTKNSEILTLALNSKEKYIEQPFYIKETLQSAPFYLTGRFDAVIKRGEKYIILDWKTGALPKEDDLQTVVYTYSASKLFNCKNIEMVYYSLEEGKAKSAFLYENCLDKIKEIILKLYN